MSDPRTLSLLLAIQVKGTCAQILYIFLHFSYDYGCKVLVVVRGKPHKELSDHRLLGY